MMRNIIFTFGLLTSTTAFANNCPDLTGLYQMAEGAVVQFQSDECTRLIRWNGFTTKKGEIVISPEKQVFQFDGSPVCTKERCQTAKATVDSVIFSLNYEGYVKIKEHGLCAHKQFALSLVDGGDLQTTYNVYNCDDGFSGSAVKSFPRLQYPENL
ncbi:hypothetical protein [Bdellovibrio sp. KM01]|uniref:hypothetical protein n=1 Tax=Bdellovibrio sp. KM01 TaxID=2748865 RepID=UPI0015E938A5|nr:hypothetical protein [Bdellovibrio sp. KM01]QLY26712.1 hypothetical protein HW988_06805 [Bdellovibrio sp. KM01]